ncbi:MAG: hypothetical protein OEQ53_22255, partial [Saprospiraceae bacterium]|nr:hypothetical protein [Saprospiraceae bacterium]
PFFDHFLSSIALHSISKFASRLLPSLLLYQELHDRPPKRITAILAALIYMYRGESKGISLPVKDSEAVTEYFQDLWKKLERNSLSRNQLASFILSKKVYWGQDLTRVPRLTNLVIDYLRLLEEKDVRALVARQT